MLKVLGLIFILVVLIIGGFLSNSYLNYQTFEKEVSAMVPGILQNLQKKDMYTSLGAYKSCPKKEGNNIEIQMSEPVTASVALNCEFENGSADVDLVLNHNESSGWVIDKQRVSSSVFNPAFNQALKDRP